LGICNFGGGCEPSALALSLELSVEVLVVDFTAPSTEELDDSVAGLGLDILWWSSV
jgi:hypothetical protein